VVRLEGVCKKLGNIQALKGVTFDLPENTVTGLLGPNGAGKTTTLRMISTLLTPDQGTVTVGGFETVSNSKDVRRIVGYLPENPPLYTELKVREYLEVVAKLRGLERASEHVDRALEQCNLQDVATRLISKLSKGFQQRVGIAQAIIHAPKVLILDEPTSGLDPVQLSEVRELIRKLSAKTTILFSSHILPEIAETCSRVILILNGSISWVGDEFSVTELEDRFIKGVRG